VKGKGMTNLTVLIEVEVKKKCSTHTKTMREKDQKGGRRRESILLPALGQEERKEKKTFSRETNKKGTKK